MPFHSAIWPQNFVFQGIIQSAQIWILHHLSFTCLAREGSLACPASLQVNGSDTFEDL